MEINESFNDKLNKLVLHWKAQGIKLNPGITIENMEKLEADFGFSFDENFDAYLKKVNGFVDFDSDKDWFSFWSANRMRVENADGSHPKNIIWFSDYSINLCAFGINKTDSKVYTHYQTIGGLECVANSFTEFIDLNLENPYELLR